MVWCLVTGCDHRSHHSKTSNYTKYGICSCCAHEIFPDEFPFRNVKCKTPVPARLGNPKRQYKRLPDKSFFAQPIIVFVK